MEKELNITEIIKRKLFLDIDEMSKQMKDADSFEGSMLNSKTEYAENLLTFIRIITGD